MIVEREEDIPLDTGGSMRAFLSLPEGAAPEGGWPVVIAIHDIFGFSPDIHRIVRRFAESGYAALAPALYDGAGAPFLCVVRTVLDQQKGEGPAFERIEDARRFLSTLPEIDGGRSAVTGFCLGGGFAIFFAARGDVQVGRRGAARVREARHRGRGCVLSVAGGGHGTGAGRGGNREHPAPDWTAAHCVARALGSAHRCGHRPRMGAGRRGHLMDVGSLAR